MKQGNRSIKSILVVIMLTAIVTAKGQNNINGSWLTKANDYNTSVGQRYTFTFPANGLTSSPVWGTGVYTTDCSIASAAVHAGLITAADGGTVTIEILPGQNSYEGSTYNGITSSNWGYYHASFMFVNTHRLINRAAPNVIYGDWVTQAREYKGNIGQRYTYYFAKGVTITGQVWGTDIYTIDCAIATAAVHAGIITKERGGFVTIEILPGQSAYKGSARNGVVSNNWGTYEGSFKFVKNNNAAMRRRNN